MDDSHFNNYNHAHVLKYFLVLTYSPLFSLHPLKNPTPFISEHKSLLPSPFAKPEIWIS